MIESLFAWTNGHRQLLQGLGIVSLVMLLLTPAIVSFLVVWLPEDYFASDRDHIHEMSKHYHPVIRMIILILKNAAGGVFLLAGIAMLVLPGQGILSILMGLTLIDFPGKKRFERRMVRKEKVLSTINWIRAKAGKPPLQIES